MLSETRATVSCYEVLLAILVSLLLLIGTDSDSNRIPTFDTMSGCHLSIEVIWTLHCGVISTSPLISETEVPYLLPISLSCPSKAIANVGSSLTFFPKAQMQS